MHTLNYTSLEANDQSKKEREKQMIIFEILKSFQDPETVSLMRLYQFTDKFIDSMKHIENLVSMFPQQLNLDLITFRGGL